MARTKKITREESKLALQAQAPLTPRKSSDKKSESIATINRRGAKNPVKKSTNGPLSFGDLKNEIRKFTGADTDSDHLEWIKPVELEGKPFYIKRAWTFESSYGSKVGYVVFVDGEEFLMSLQWSRNRDTFVKGIRSLLRREGADAVIGPLTVELVDVGQANPYIDIVAYRE